MVIFIRFVFPEGNKYYPQDFLDDILCNLWMLENNEVDVSERIAVNKTSDSL